MTDNVNEDNTLTATQFSNAFWVDPDHRRFHVDVTMSDGSEFPFTYVADGSDDNDGPVSVAVRNAYHNNEIQIHEYPESLQVKNEIRKIKSIRSYRNLLLNETDKYMTLDYPISDEDRNLIKVYRQALRDIPEQDGFPENIVWPEKPNCI